MLESSLDVDPSEAAVALVADWEEALAANETRTSEAGRIRAVDLVMSAKSKRTFPSNYGSDRA